LDAVGRGLVWSKVRIAVRGALNRRNKKVGVAANSHKVIHNLLDMVEDIATRLGVSLQGVKKSSSGNDGSLYDKRFIRSEEKPEKISVSAPLLAGSAWLVFHEGSAQHWITVSNIA
jgi:hypothetical protein